jgi:POT family proton-dependent oligopeptide transporter
MNIVVLAGVVITVLTAIPVLIQLRNHPRGLFILFFAEMWERFSYYGMRGLLILYLTQKFLFDEREAAGHYGAYVAMVYLTPLVGGILADRFLGTRKAIQFGAVLLVIGQLGLAVEGPQAKQILTYAGVHYPIDVDGRGSLRQAHIRVDAKDYAFGPADGGGLSIKALPPKAALPSVLPKGRYALSVEDRSPLYLNLFYLALGVIIMGVGFLKANISSIVGQPPRSGVHSLLLRREPRGLLGGHPLRSSRRDCGLVGRLRPGGRGDVGGMDRVHARPQLARRQGRAAGPGASEAPDPGPHQP